MSGTPWLDEVEDAAWRGWLAASERIRTAVSRDLVRDHGLSEPEFAVLVHLSESPGRSMRMTDLADGLTWSRSRLSHLAGRMEARGLLARRGCPSDARGAFATLTAAGLSEITEAAPSHVRSVRRAMFDHLDSEQVRQLGSITAALLAGLAPAGPDDCPPCADPDHR